MRIQIGVLAIMQPTKLVVKQETVLSTASVKRQNCQKINNTFNLTIYIIYNVIT